MPLHNVWLGIFQLFIAFLLQKQFQERVINRRRAEYDRLRAEREERLSQVREARKQEREIKRKMLYYLRTEEERLNQLREEEEARKREGIP